MVAYLQILLFDAFLFLRRAFTAPWGATVSLLHPLSLPPVYEINVVNNYRTARRHIEKGSNLRATVMSFLLVVRWFALLYYTENGSRNFVRKVSELPPGYKVSHSSRQRYS
jgi:hypothetical protein